LSNAHEKPKIDLKKGPKNTKKQGKKYLKLNKNAKKQYKNIKFYSKM